MQTLLQYWFINSPFSYLLPSSILTSSPNTIDPALLSVLLGISLSLPSCPPLSSSCPPTQTFLNYSLSLLLSRPTTFACTSLSTIHAILLLGVHLGTEHRIRQAWALMASGYALSREMLQKVELRRESGAPRGEKERCEEEGLRNVLWTFGESLQEMWMPGDG